MLQEIEKKNLINIVTHILEQERRDKIKFIDIHYRSIIKEQLKFISENLSKNAVNKCKYLQFLYFLNVIIIFTYLWLWNQNRKIPNEDYYNQFIQNQNQGIIEDINITYDGNCQKAFGYQYSPLFEYLWPGTVYGCDCTKNLTIHEINEMDENTFFEKFFFIGRMCKQIEVENNCKSIQNFTSRILSQLNDNRFSQSFMLCAKRNEKISLRYNNSYCLEENKTICGKDQYQFCLPFNATCPITKIGFLQNLDDHDIFRIQQNNRSYRIIKINQEFYFYSIINSSDRLPISQVQLTESDKVCLLNSLNNIQKDRNEYYLMKVRRQNCEKTDTAFKNEFNISEEQLYLANNLRNLKHNLPFFPVSKIQNWTLQTKSYIQINPECQNSAFYEKILNKSTLTMNQEIQDIMNYIFILNLLLLITFIIEYSLDISDFKCRFSQIIQNFEKIIMLLINVLEILYIYQEIQFSKSFEDFQNFNYMNCIQTGNQPDIFNYIEMKESKVFWIEFIFYPIQMVCFLRIIYEYGTNLRNICNLRPVNSLITMFLQCKNRIRDEVAFE
ncbi:unnamed protein product [Paramecium sonneborni]|uniref:Transmembrane protein n=1 Tax=Paramecium sonneborni TaxID=65129 RepID=A0A8S1NPW5_9CILI|nr:unnamed protein product [Paramecium sonneborni]